MNAQQYDYETLDAETYRCRTIITYTGDAEVREYEIPAGELTDWYVRMADPQHGEEVVGIDPV